MPRIATLSLRDHTGDDLLTQLAQVLFGTRKHAFVQGLDLSSGDCESDPVVRDEFEAFLDWDQIRGDGRGFFSGDRHECATRRIDLRGPTDLDPGPLPMEEWPSDEVDSSSSSFFVVALS